MVGRCAVSAGSVKVGNPALGVFAGGTPENLLTYWKQRIYILKSGATWYKREKDADNFYLKYSSDSGANWDLLLTLDLTEDSFIIDPTHLYTHLIVGTAYVVKNGGDILFTT